MYEFTKPPKKPKVFCVCNSAAPILIYCRLFGLLPITWKHVNGKCTYSISKLWILHSFVIAAFFAFRMSEIFHVIINPFNGDRSSILDYIATFIEGILINGTIVLIVLNIFRAPKFAEVMNTLTELTLEDLLCQNALKTFNSLNKHVLVSNILLYGTDYAVILVVNCMDRYDTNWNYARILMPLIQTTFTHFHSVFAAMCTLCLAAMHCYLNKMRHSLRLVSVHPIPEYRDNESGVRLLVRKYNLCNEKHLKVMPRGEILAHLQKLYKQIQKNLDRLNDAFNPQIVLNMTCELLAIVFHIYAVIIFLTFGEASPSDKTNNIFNWLFAVLRMISVYIFLNTAQHIEDLVKKLVKLLLEYSSRISSAEEHQQVRIFVQQLGNYRGFSASGIFTVNLNIAAPICGNILMYVLVAIQFKIPQEIFHNSTEPLDLEHHPAIIY